MHPLSIILAFVFLGSLVVVGTVLVGVGVWKIRGQVHPANLTGFSGVITPSTLLSTCVMALGLLLLFYGVTGTYRVVWGI